MKPPTPHAASYQNGCGECQRRRTQMTCEERDLTVYVRKVSRRDGPTAKQIEEIVRLRAMKDRAKAMFVRHQELCPILSSDSR